MKTPPFDNPLLNEIAKVPAIWNHKHYVDECEGYYDIEFIDYCDTCREGFEQALEKKGLCHKHPFAYYEPATKERPAYCEDCDETKQR
jgi:hypothetical protein